MDEQQTQIIAVLRDLVDYMDTIPLPVWSEQFVNVLIAYADARGIDRDRLVTDVLTADWKEEQVTP